MTIQDAVYRAIHDLDGGHFGTENELRTKASEIYGKRLTLEEFHDALASIDTRGTSATGPN